MFITHSAYSFRFGVLSTEQIIRLAEKHGCIPLVLAEINSTAGILPALQMANIPIQPAVDLREGAVRKALLIPESPMGFQNLNEWLSKDQRDLKYLNLKEIRVVYPLKQAPKRRLYSNEWIGVEVSEQIKANNHKQFNRCIAWETLAFENVRDYNAHKLLRSIDKNTVLSNLNRFDYIAHDCMWKDKSVIESQFSQTLWSSSQYFIKSLPPWDQFLNRGPGSKNQKTYTGKADKDRALLKQLCYDALPKRYQYVNQNIKDRLKKELELITEKSFLSYFLINWDIIRYAQKENFFYVGRGSGANSIVAYLLNITNVDPVDLDLYFERFINLHRQSPPDFDIDFSWRDRPRITEYIFNRFSNTSLLGACNTFQHRSAIREIGKVFGLPKLEIDDLINKGIANNEDNIAKCIINYANRIKGLPNQMTIHSGGIVITNEPIQVFSSTFLPPKGFPTANFDMYTAEKLGIHKFDILGQRGVSKISECIDIIKKNYPKKSKLIDIHNIQKIKSDPASISLLQKGETLGCFYIESPAMRMLMKKLKTSNYLELVAASSIIRPGVAKSGMMREYIERHRFPKLRKNANPILTAIMPETYGIMVYQEDVIKVAHKYADLTLSEADILRRGMSGKYRSKEEIIALKKQFLINCKRKGYLASDYKEVWRQIESFAGYAFAKGHSASYALESLQSLYLKAHFPIEYMVATINNGGGFYKAEFYFHEAKQCGAKIEPPCVNEGELTTVIRPKNRIIIGTERISGIDVELCREIEAERKKNGAYSSLNNFINRLKKKTGKLTLDSLLLLIKSEAFRFTKRPKRDVLWDAYHQIRHKKEGESTLLIFENSPKSLALPKLENSELDDLYDQEELFGFSLSHPFRLFTGWQGKKSTSVKDWSSYIDNTIRTIGYVIAVKRNETEKGEFMQFGTFLEISGEIFNTVHFPNSIRNNIIRRNGVYLLHGYVRDDYGYLTLEVFDCNYCPRRPDSRYTDMKTQLPVN